MRHVFSTILALVALLPLGACDGDQAATQVSATQVPASPAAALTAGVDATAAPAASATPNATPTLGVGMFANPVINQDFPDPDILKVGDTYYAYATGNFDAKISVQTARSQNLVHWEQLSDAMPTFPAWAEHDHGLVWAPEVTTSADGKTFLLYFTARVAGTSRQCIGLATSTKPEGPFDSPDEQPIICQTNQGGSIDASSFVDDDGTRYLLWKNDGNCCGQETYIYIQKISNDGRILEGQPTQLIQSDQSWEGALVEAPTLWKHAGKCYLFYSANNYNTPNYAIGYAVADSPLGPYQKAKRPLVASSIKDAVVGPGGQDIVLDPEGDMWMLYHSWGPGYRTMSIDVLVWEGETPVLKGPNGRKMPQLMPSS
jgi:beta-xylosidase